MLTEEAHHMFVGQTGVRRVIKRACELMKEHNTDDVRPFGGISLKLIQKYINFWYSSTLDLYGSEISTNAATYFANGLKGRAHEAASKGLDHVAKDGIYPVSYTHLDVYKRQARDPHPADVVEPEPAPVVQQQVDLVTVPIP